MIYAHNSYKIEDLFVCNLKKLGIPIDDNQKDMKFILCRFNSDLGYDCKAGRYSCCYSETITTIKIESIRSHKKIENLPCNTNIIYNAENIDINLFTDDELREGYVSDLRLFQIYNIINFQKEKERPLIKKCNN